MQYRIAFWLCLLIGIGQTTYAQSTLSEFSTQFLVKSFGYGTIKGNFENIQGTIQLDTLNLEHSNFQLQLDTKTIQTGKKLVNKFVKSKAFFASEKYPEMTFQSTQFSKTATGYSVQGILIIKGQSKLIDLPFKLTSDGENLFLNANICLNRMEVDLGKNYSRFLIKKEVKISISSVLPLSIIQAKSSYVVR